MRGCSLFGYMPIQTHGYIIARYRRGEVHGRQANAKEHLNEQMLFGI